VTCGNYASRAQAASSENDSVVKSLGAIENSLLLGGLDRHALALLADSMVEESWPRGRQIMGRSDSADWFRLVTAGRVKIVRSNASDAHEVVLWLLGPGDGFDFVSLLDGKPHAVSAWTLESVRTLAAPMTVWRERLERSPALRLAVHRYIGVKLRELTDLTSDLALHDTPTRLAHLLLRHFDGAEPNLLRDLPQRELASMIGSVRIVVSRLLAQMRREGVVELQRGAIHAVDLKRLLRKAEAHLAQPAPRAREPQTRAH
jgi:CRP-like cAMP-binding protein